MEHSHTHHTDHSSMVKDFQIRFWVSLALTVSVLLLHKYTYLSFFVSTLIYFYGGWPFLKGLKEEIQQKQPGMMTLIGVAITAAYLYSTVVSFGLQGSVFFWELATLIDIMLLGHWIEMKSVMGAGRALEQLVSLIPDVAHQLIDNGELQDVPTHALKQGDRCLVKPGERVPADGIVLQGMTSMNESMLTGESTPAIKHVGDAVIGGSMNGEGAVTLEIQKTGEDSFIYGVVRLVREAQASKSRTQDIANRAAMWLTVIALGGRSWA